MRKWILGAGLVAASVGLAGTAVAAPKDKTETFVCDGQETTFIVGGRSGFLDGVHYLAHNLVIVGMFDPTGPAPAKSTPIVDPTRLLLREQRRDLRLLHLLLAVVLVDDERRSARRDPYHEVAEAEHLLHLRVLLQDLEVRVALRLHRQ